MKIIIGYPPTESKKGIATLGQNRQFQWFSNQTFFYPVVMAIGATLLKQNSHDVKWIDCVSEKISISNFINFIKNFKPDLFIFETKTPVIKQHWKMINLLKEKFSSMKIAICGDHVTSFPEETMKNSKVDFVLTGGDYDFISLELANWISGKTKRIPKGIYYRKRNKIIGSKFELNHKLDEAPFPDRELTKWKNYQKEYNISRSPYFYIMSGRDCWWGKCKFCAWPRLYPCFRNRSVENVLNEINILIKKYGAREIFDDSGTLTTGKWLKDLCNGLIKGGYNKKIRYSCNMRFGVLKQEYYNLMKKAGFRLLKFGLESASQETLDRLDKGVKIKEIIDGCKMAKKAGLSVHLTMIVGYPWETKKDALKTFMLAKYLMQNGYADLLQATVLVPYPGTPLWKEAKKNDWFLFNPEEYERYDMREPVLKTKNSDSEISNKISDSKTSHEKEVSDAKDVAAVCGKIYTIFLTPKYVFARIKNIRGWDDIKLNLRGIKAVFGHLNDFLYRNKK